MENWIWMNLTQISTAPQAKALSSTLNETSWLQSEYCFNLKLLPLANWVSDKERVKNKEHIAIGHRQSLQTLALFKFFGRDRFFVLHRSVILSHSCYLFITFLHFLPFIFMQTEWYNKGSYYSTHWYWLSFCIFI